MELRKIYETYNPNKGMDKVCLEMSILIRIREVEMFLYDTVLELY